MTYQADERIMAECCLRYLSKRDALFVASIAVSFPERFAALMSVYGGQLLTPQEVAALHLRVCKLITTSMPA